MTEQVLANSVIRKRLKGAHSFLLKERAALLEQERTTGILDGQIDAIERHLDGRWHLQVALHNPNEMVYCSSVQLCDDEHGRPVHLLQLFNDEQLEVPSADVRSVTIAVSEY